MATPTGLNVIDCSAQGARGTGLAYCKTNRKRVAVLYLFPPDHTFTADIDLAYMQAQQVAGNLIVLPNVSSFIDSTPDATITAREGSGIKVLVNQFPYEYTASFDNGFMFQQDLDSLSGSGNYSVVIQDVDDVLWFTKSRSGVAKPFTMGIHQVGKYLGEDGTNLATETYFMQLTDRKEVDARMVMLKPDFGGTDVKGVNDVTITIDPITAPSTSLVFSPLLNDGTHMAKGLLAGDYVFTKNGTVITPTISADETTKKVTATLAAASTAADVYTVKIDGIVLISVSEILYKSPEVATVVAG